MDRRHLVQGWGRWGRVGGWAATLVAGAIPSWAQSGGDWSPYVVVELPTPAGLSPLAEEGRVDVNAAGDVVATLVDGQSQRLIHRWIDEDAVALEGEASDGWTLLHVGGNPLIGTAHAINDAGQVAGWRVAGGAIKAMRWTPTSGGPGGTVQDFGNGYAHDLDGDGRSVGVSATGAPAAWDSVQPLQPLPGAQASSAWGVEHDGRGWIVGASDVGAQTPGHAVIWHYNGQAVTNLSPGAGVDHRADAVVAAGGIPLVAGWKDAGLSGRELLIWEWDGVDWNNPVATGVHARTLRSGDLPRRLDLNVHGEATAGRFLWWRDSMGAGHAIDLLEADGAEAMGAVGLEAHALNDAGEVVGLFKRLDGTLGVFKAVPYDLDNEGTPDFRQILSGTMADTNGNWVSDEFESLHAGLFGPGVYGTGLPVDHVQTVRLMDFNQRDLECLLHGQNALICCTGCSGQGWPDAKTCVEWLELFASWGVARTPAAEVVLNLRTVDPNPGQEQFDYLAPTSGNGITRGRIESNLRTFGFRFARCIDGFQAGNEVYSGPGRYFFYPGDLPGDCEGPNGREIRDMTPNCFVPACEAMLAQLGGQIEAARFGSALAGRPWRLYGPSIARPSVEAGYCGEAKAVPVSGADREATGVDCLSGYANRHDAAFDLHLYYEPDFPIERTVRQMLGDWGGWTGGAYHDECPTDDTPGWEAPRRITCFEWGPMPSQEWWNDPPFNPHWQQAAMFYESRDQFGNWLPCAPPTGYDSWDEFVADWKQIEFNDSDGGYRFDEFFQTLSEFGFLHGCLNVAQRGLSDQGVPSRQDLGAMRANKVNPNCVDAPSQLMLIHADYESAAQPYVISDLIDRTHCECGEVRDDCS